MLTIIGMFFLAFGAWFCGAVFMATPSVAFLPKEQPYRSRVIGGYMIGASFVGIGTMLVVGI